MTIFALTLLWIMPSGNVADIVYICINISGCKGLTNGHGEEMEDRERGRKEVRQCD